MTSYTVINPATEQPVTQVEHTTAEQTDAAAGVLARRRPR
jgi:acyl-CoA reductase-like NAD-dependent aldehyde dehydrogenase